MKRITLLISIFAAVFWFGAALFLAKWTMAWLRGNLTPGDNTSGTILFGFFLFCALATGLGFYTTARAWLGKSNTKWQAASLICAFLIFLAVAGH
jgi:hypothetical protein